MTGSVVSVNVGRVQAGPWNRKQRSATDKRPVGGPVSVEPLGLAGDEVGDTAHHGGLDQAVYAYAEEDLAYWAERLGRRLVPGQFGENLTTRGVDVTGARLGERWRVGEVLLEVSSVRTPCRTFAGFLQEKKIVKDFTAAGRPGAYLRVVEPGALCAGDTVTVVEDRGHDITVGLMFRAITTERELLPRLLDEPRIAAKQLAKARAAVSSPRW